VRLVETQQRLLYKLRHSLIEGLSEAECLCLREELHIQSRGSSTVSSSSTSSGSTPSLPSPPKAHVSSTSINDTNHTDGKPPLKRSAPSDVQDSGSNTKIHVSNGYYMAHSTTSNMVSSPVTGTSTADTASSNVNSSQSDNQGQDNSVYMYQNPVYYNNDTSSNQSSNDASGINSLPHYLLAPPAPAPPIPYHPHPPLKRWPNDYTVSELSTGFHAMDLLIAHSASGAGMTQRQAFERVFGSRYVKSTVCRHRAVWRKAHPSLREQFEAMGSDDRACWGEFVRRVEGRPPGKGAGGDMLSPSPSATMGYHDGQSGGEDDDVHADSVLGSLQTQGTLSFLVSFDDL